MTWSLVGLESLSERDRLWFADFDPQVCWISSRPFWVSGRDRSTLRHHVPDFMLASLDGSYTVVDVKPRDLMDEPSVAEISDWTRHLCTAKGWRYAVWSGGDPVVLRNPPLFRRWPPPVWLNQATVDLVRAVGSPGLTLDQVEHRGHGPRDEIRVAALALLWSGHLEDRPVHAAVGAVGGARNRARIMNSAGFDTQLQSLRASGDRPTKSSPTRGTQPELSRSRRRRRPRNVTRNPWFAGGASSTNSNSRTLTPPSFSTTTS